MSRDIGIHHTQQSHRVNMDQLLRSMQSGELQSALNDAVDEYNEKKGPKPEIIAEVTKS